MNKENKIRKELEKVLLTYEKPSIYFKKLRKDNKLKILYPEINDLIGVIQSPIHHPEGDVFNHTMMVVDDLLVFPISPLKLAEYDCITPNSCI